VLRSSPQSWQRPSTGNSTCHDTFTMRFTRISWSRYCECLFAFVISRASLARTVPRANSHLQRTTGSIIHVSHLAPPHRSLSPIPLDPRFLWIPKWCIRQEWPTMRGGDTERAGGGAHGPTGPGTQRRRAAGDPAAKPVAEGRCAHRGAGADDPVRERGAGGARDCGPLGHRPRCRAAVGQALQRRGARGAAGPAAVRAARHLYARAGRRDDRSGADRSAGPRTGLRQLDVSASGVLPQRAAGHWHPDEPAACDLAGRRLALADPGELVWRARRSRLRAKKGGIETLRRPPPPGSLGLDHHKLGPEATMPVHELYALG